MSTSHHNKEKSSKAASPLNNKEAKVTTKTRPPKAPAYRPTGTTTLTGSANAKRLAAGILEVLGGLRPTSEGAEALGISLPRYYVLETRALQGLIDAMEPLPRGRQKKPVDIIETLQQDKSRLEREILRLQSLVRLAQRAIGLPTAEAIQQPPRKGSKASKTAAGEPGTKKKRRRNRTANRANKAVAALRKQADVDPSGNGSASAPVDPDSLM